MVFRVAAVCGSHTESVMQDSRLFEDFVLMHDLLPQAAESSWLLGIDLQDPRAVQGRTLREVPWSTKIQPRQLKRKFLKTLKTMTSLTKPEDVLLVFLCGYGAEDYSNKGSVEIGESRFGVPKLLFPMEVLRIIAGCEGHTTVIVNSCYSGFWLEEGRMSGLGGVTIITGSTSYERISEYSISASDTLRPADHQAGSGLYKEIFPAHNTDIVRSNSPPRKEWHNLKELVQQIAEEKSAQRQVASHPQVNNPAESGCFRGLRQSTEHLIRQYQALPVSPPTAGHNVGLQIMISCFLHGKAENEAELRRCLKRRLALYKSGWELAVQLGISEYWPKGTWRDWKPAGPAARKRYAGCRRLYDFVEYESNGVLWGDVQRILIIVLADSGTSPSRPELHKTAWRRSLMRTWGLR